MSNNTNDINWDLFKSRIDNIKRLRAIPTCLTGLPIIRCESSINSFKPIGDVKLDQHTSEYIQEKLIGKSEFMIENRTAHKGFQIKETLII